MNAIEFVKEFKLFGAKEYLSGATFYKDKLMVFTNIEDLKQIVEAFELVGQYHGINGAKVKLRSLHDDSSFKGILSKAINLVEKCQK